MSYVSRATIGHDLPRCRHYPLLHQGEYTGHGLTWADMRCGAPFLSFAKIVPVDATTFDASLRMVLFHSWKDFPPLAGIRRLSSASQMPRGQNDQAHLLSMRSSFRWIRYGRSCSVILHICSI